MNGASKQGDVALSWITWKKEHNLRAPPYWKMRTGNGLQRCSSARPNISKHVENQPTARAARVQPLRVQNTATEAAAQWLCFRRSPGSRASKNSYKNTLLLGGSRTESRNAAATSFNQHCCYQNLSPCLPLPLQHSCRVQPLNF